MTLAFAAAVPRRAERGEAFRWGAGLAVALSLHLLGAVALYDWHHQPEPPPELPPAVMIELEPLPTPPVVAAVLPPPEIAPPPPVETPPPPLDTLPPPVVAAPPVVELPPPSPPPKPVARHVPVKIQHPVVTAPPAPAVPPPQAVVEAPAPIALPPAAPVSNSLPSFRALMAAHLERYKRYPKTSQQRGEEGTVTLRFTVDRKGAVLAAQIDQKSGHTLLDEEVLALVRRAEPLPPIPPDMPDTKLEIVVPVDFRLH